MWSNDNLILVAIDVGVLLREKKQRFLMLNILQKRNIGGEYKILFRGPINDETKLYYYFCIPKFKFHELLSLIEPVITKQNITFR